MAACKPVSQAARLSSQGCWVDTACSCGYVVMFSKPPFVLGNMRRHRARGERLAVGDRTRATSGQALAAHTRIRQATSARAPWAFARRAEYGWAVQRVGAFNIAPLSRDEVWQEQSSQNSKYGPGRRKEALASCYGIQGKREAAWPERKATRAREMLFGDMRSCASMLCVPLVLVPFLAVFLTASLAPSPSRRAFSSLLPPALVLRCELWTQRLSFVFLALIGSETVVFATDHRCGTSMLKV